MPSTDAFAVAFGAGVVAAVNPCGFALLPAYLSLFVLGEDRSRERSARPAAVGRALRATAALTLGFAGVFLVFGLAVAPVAAAVQACLPAFTVVLGLVVAAAGGWLLTGRSLPSITIGRRPGKQGAPTAGFGSMTGFGVSYAIASLGCTVAPFLAVVVTAFRVDSPVAGVLLFLTYAGAMGLMVGTAAVGVALARDGLITRARRAGGRLPKAGGALLLVAGLYVAWYGFWELRVLHAGAGADPVVEAAGAIQRFLSEIAPWIAYAGVALIAVTLVVVAVRRVRRRAGATRVPR
ncbi:cytochrome c biogenesis CcdA family protein [Myceligenerans pegani]|uniref:Cytochrome c biogenesis protein CcdA n=1 Tax=Myceligenerans pegani TaxID=2776917 RepID=A0ABR9MV12_9MICO|nr:cytochrome c biogenesis protein CcdA [Myceligenerans sp. TRM 65318]MBE1874612.1 cytochrome c biogenesis protein CcdA [Myceligenerans sp. TRM 65318]MBE3016883.1 cytochrome c biogenesis protein CcdA [Myceligenerans sp. TRM 65318]